LLLLPLQHVSFSFSILAFHFIIGVFLLPSVATLGGTYDRGGASLVGQEGHLIIAEGAVGWQRRRRRLFVRKKEVAA